MICCIIVLNYLLLLLWMSPNHFCFVSWKGCEPTSTRSNNLSSLYKRRSQTENNRCLLPCYRVHFTIFIRSSDPSQLPRISIKHFDSSLTKARKTSRDLKVPEVYDQDTCTPIAPISWMITARSLLLHPDLHAPRCMCNSPPSIPVCPSSLW